MDSIRRPAAAVLVIAALVAAGCGASTTTSNTSASSAASTTATPAGAGAGAGAPAGRPNGPGGAGGGTPVVGPTADKVKAAALAKYPGGTIQDIVQVPDGSYVAGVVPKSGGSEIHVLVSTSFTVTGARSGPPRGGPGGARPGAPGAAPAGAPA